jgi:hypothetical protein
VADHIRAARRPFATVPERHKFRRRAAPRMLCFAPKLRHPGKTMRIGTTGTTAVAFFLLLTAVPGTADELHIKGNVATLTDDPGVRFETSGWKHANSSNPFLLTPDQLTNAMVGVTRLRPGQPFLTNGPVIPKSLDAATVQVLLAERLRGKPNVSVSSETIGGRQVAVAKYADAYTRRVEYAFPLKEHLVHVILIAKEGKYFDSGNQVARKVVQTLKPL